MGNTIRILYLDDNQIDLSLAEYLISGFPNLKLIGKCTDPLEALTIIKKEKPDIVFLDLLLPEYNGFELAELLKEANCHLVFLTGLEYYAIEAFKLYALDYIVKPLRKIDIEGILDKFNSIKNNFGNAEILHIAELIRYRNRQVSAPTKVFATSTNLMQVVDISTINYFENVNNETIIHLETKKELLSQKYFEKYIKTISRNSDFICIANKYIVNKIKIKSFETKDNIIKLKFNNNKSLEFEDSNQINWIENLIQN